MEAMRVLVVEQDATSRDTTTQMLHAMGCVVTHARRIEDAFFLVSHQKVDMVLTDVWSGVDVYNGVPIVWVNAPTPRAKTPQRLRRQAVRYLARQGAA
ncbi:MAG TPA: response regulator [Candidatus Xenobia bacterium]|jgi:DNA-binding NtrC family response regulator